MQAVKEPDTPSTEATVTTKAILGAASLFAVTLLGGGGALVVVSSLFSRSSPVASRIFLENSFGLLDSIWMRAVF